MRTLTYYVDSVPYTGTLNDLARVMQDHEYGSGTYVSPIITDGNGQARMVNIVRSDWDDNNMAYVELSVSGYDSVVYRVDGNA